MAHIIYEDNDNVIEVSELKDQVADTFLNNQIVEVTIKDLDGTELSGQTWPISLSYVSGSNGKYRATLPDTLAFDSDKEYVAEVDVQAGAGKSAKFILDLVIRDRFV